MEGGGGRGIGDGGGNRRKVRKHLWGPFIARGREGGMGRKSVPRSIPAHIFPFPCLPNEERELEMAQSPSLAGWRRWLSAKLFRAFFHPLLISSFLANGGVASAKERREEEKEP